MPTDTPASESLYPIFPVLNDADVRRIVRQELCSERERVVAVIRRVIRAGITEPNMSRDEQDDLLVDAVQDIFQSEELARELTKVLRANPDQG